MTITGTKGRLLAGVAVFLGLLVVFYFFFYTPRMVYRENLRQQISREETRLEQLLSRYKELAQLQEEHESLQAQVRQMENAFRQDQATFLRALGRKGQVYGVEYVDIVPLESTEAEFYVRTPVSLFLFGDYHSLGALLADLANTTGRGYFTVDSALFRQDSQPPHSLQANLEISLYDYKGISLGSNNLTNAAAGDSADLVSNRRPR